MTKINVESFETLRDAILAICDVFGKMEISEPIGILACMSLAVFLMKKNNMSKAVAIETVNTLWDRPV